MDISTSPAIRADVVAAIDAAMENTRAEHPIIKKLQLSITRYPGSSILERSLDVKLGDGDEGDVAAAEAAVERLRDHLKAIAPDGDTGFPEPNGRFPRESPLPCWTPW